MKALEQGDRDGNGALDQAEYWAVTQAQAKARAQRTAQAGEDASAAGGVGATLVVARPAEKAPQTPSLAA